MNFHKRFSQNFTNKEFMNKSCKSGAELMVFSARRPFYALTVTMRMTCDMPIWGFTVFVPVNNSFIRRTKYWSYQNTVVPCFGKTCTHLRFG